MKKYYRVFRKKSNAIFFGVIGGLLLALGILGAFWANTRVIAIICLVGGVLLGTVPMLVLFSRIWSDGERLHYREKCIARTIPLSQIGAVILCTYDEYRRGKGFVNAAVKTAEGEDVNVPAIVFLRSVDENELDLCQTRTNTKLTFRRERITDAVLDFDFLQSLYDSSFGGTVYVSKYVADLFQPALDRIFQGDSRVVVFDNIPKKMKQFQK